MEVAIQTDKSEDIDELVRLMTLFNEAVEDTFLLFSHTNNMVLYSTKSFRELTGITQEEILKKGRDLLLQIIHPKDLKLLMLVHESTMQFINRKYAEEHTAKFLFSYNFRLLCTDGEFRHMNAYFKPAYFNQAGEAEMSILMLTTSHKKGFDRFALYQIEGERKLFFSASHNGYVTPDTVELNERERDILRLVSNGFREAAIARKLSLKHDLVKYYKKSIYKKFHVNNAQEAVYIGLFYNLI